MIALIKKMLPQAFLEKIVNSSLIFTVLKFRYSLLGRPIREAETAKARPRRQREGFFANYCQGEGLDIGYGGDLLAPNCRGYDIEDGNAQLLQGVADESYDFVYSSHTLEHMLDPATALVNWGRVVKAGGFLILYIPHRDLYEKRKTLPSNWNYGHRQFFLPHDDESPDTIGIVPLILRTLTKYEFVYVKTCSDGHTITEPLIHSDGEYSIEIVLRKIAMHKMPDSRHIHVGNN